MGGGTKRTERLVGGGELAPKVMLLEDLGLLDAQILIEFL